MFMPPALAHAHLHALAIEERERHVEEPAEEEREEADARCRRSATRSSRAAPCRRWRGCYAWAASSGSGRPGISRRGRRRCGRFVGVRLRKMSSRLMRMRPQLEQAPAAIDDRRRQLAAHVAPARVVDFDVDEPSRARRRRHARDALDGAQRRPACRRAAPPPADTSSRSRAAAPSGCRACRRRPPCPC